MEGPQVELTDIQRFYKNTTVFLTGVTGFIGKLFLEKVLRALPVERVFLLIREKKAVPAAQRCRNIFESPIFDQLKRTSPEVFNKVTLIEGDCSLPLLGITESDMEILVQQVSVVFHCAATVRFNDHIKRATRINVRATKDLVDLAGRMRKLKTFVYVGTGFSNSNKLEIKEEIYPSKISAESLISACESLDDDCLTSMTKTLINDWPNTYTFTKQVTEEYIGRAGKDLPICIARPTIVTSTFMEPVRAFVDSVFTLAGFVLANGLGLSRITYYKNVKVDIIPADYVINECIAAGWYTGEAFQRGKINEIPVFNMSSGLDNPISQDDVYGICDYYARQISTTHMVMYPMYFRTTCKYNYLILRFFFHTLLAYIIDLFIKLQGKKPMYAEGIKKLHNFQETYVHFTVNDFYIHVENTHMLFKKMSFRDRELFNFDIASLSWDNYFSQYCKGVRFYLLKESMDTIPEAMKRYTYLKRIMIVSMVIVTVFVYLLGKIFLFRVLPFVFGIIAYFLRDLIC